MGETKEYQPLTTTDKVTVVVYRSGIALSALTSAVGAYMVFASSGPGAAPPSGTVVLALVLAMYVGVGLSSFFIHLYMGDFARYLKIAYVVALACLVALFLSGGSDLSVALSDRPYLSLLLIPVLGCLGFITAKEAYCFKLMEGYALAGVMPAYLVIVATGWLPPTGVAIGLIVVAAMLVLFTLRKVFMPLYCDIGDKTAYT